MGNFSNNKKKVPQEVGSKLGGSRSWTPFLKIACLSKKNNPQFCLHCELSLQMIEFISSRLGETSVMCRNSGIAPQICFSFYTNKTLLIGLNFLKQ